MSTQPIQTEQTNALQAFDEMLATVTLAVKPIFEIKVNDEASEKRAQAAGGQIVSLSKEVENRRKELIAPLKLQIEAIENAARKVKAVLAEPEIHVRKELNSYAQELARKREEALRIQREKEAAERRAAEEKRRQEEAALRARQEEERRAREAAAEAERKRLEEEAAAKAKAARVFGASEEAKRKAEQEAELARRQAEEKVAADRRALEEEQERQRIAEQARIQREADERHAAMEAERKAIEATRVKGAKAEVIVEVVDPWLIPRHLCRAPEPKLAEIKSEFKRSGEQIPGLRIRTEDKVSLRSQAVPAPSAFVN